MYEMLEDEFGDIVAKARRGQQIEVGALAAQVGLSAAEMARLENYQLVPPSETIERLAQVLGLDARKLKASAAAAYFPRHPAGPDHEKMAVEMMVLGTGFLVNSYLAICRHTGKALLVDPGFDAPLLLARAREKGAQIERIVLTHGHHDHVGALVQVQRQTRAPAHIHAADQGLMGEAAEAVSGLLREGEVVECGRLRFELRATPGHTPGGMSLVGEGAAFVGDALFAGSLGGTRTRADYERQRRAVREKILNLAGEYALYPGHGPATTAGEERANNPFFDF